MSCRAIRDVFENIAKNAEMMGTSPSNGNYTKKGTQTKQGNQLLTVLHPVTFNEKRCGLTAIQSPKNSCTSLTTSNSSASAKYLMSCLLTTLLKSKSTHKNSLHSSQYSRHLSTIDQACYWLTGTFRFFSRAPSTYTILESS